MVWYYKMCITYEEIILNEYEQFLDRGALFYPSKEFVARLDTILRFLSKILPELSRCRNILRSLVHFLTPYLVTCSTFLCHVGKRTRNPANHNQEMIMLIIWKFVNPILTNYETMNSDLFAKSSSIEHNKHENRKYLTFT